MTWIDNDGGFKLTGSLGSTRVGGRGRRDEGGGERKERTGRMEEGRKGGEEEGVARRQYKALTTTTFQPLAFGGAENHVGSIG